MSRKFAPLLGLMLLASQVATAQEPYFQPLTSEQAWKLLPHAEENSGADLPMWARVLAKSLPGTTATMLELEYRHRVDSPLDPMLRAQMRWVAAHANRSGFGMELASADLRRAGAKDADLERLREGEAKWNEKERRALTFARKLTLEAYAVTDQEVAELVAEHGDAKTVAMVLLLAHANFQDRMMHSLGISGKSELTPRSYRFAKSKDVEQSVLPRKAPMTDAKPSSFRLVDPEWTSADYDALQKKLSTQKAKPGRIAVPDWDKIADNFPEEQRRKGPLRVKWSLVCMGYQPSLASGWSACTRSYAKEANPDRVFDETLFWVVTRSLKCFY